MQTDEIVRRLEPWLARHRRPAWRPVVEPGDGPATASKFCGTPWTGPDAPWPNCGNCGQPLRSFLQLDLADLPAELGQPFGAGLLQLFYCTRDECEGYGGWEPFADDLSRVRVVRPTGPEPAPAGLPQDGSFPPKRIVGWERFLDLPKPEEHRELGLEYTYDHQAGTVRLGCEELGLVLDGIRDPYLAENVANARLGDKLGGWPAWVQNVEYPSCSRCGRQMAFVFQWTRSTTSRSCSGMPGAGTSPNARSTSRSSPSPGPATDPQRPTKMTTARLNTRPCKKNYSD